MIDEPPMNATESRHDPSLFFADIRGQEYATTVLSESLRSGKLSGSYLFVGPEGTGKHSTALRFAAALCGAASAGDAIMRRVLSGSYPDVRSVAPVPPRRNITVGQIWPRSESQEFRPESSLLRDLNYEPLYSPKRVYIIDHAEGLSIGGSEAANSVLKTLEEPPPFVHFILTASSIASMLPTIVSRCQVVRFGSLSRQDIASVLVDSLAISAERAGLFAALSDGSLGRASTLHANPSLLEARDKIFDVVLKLDSYPRSAFARLAEEFRAACKSINLSVEGVETEAKPSGVRASTLIGLEILSSCYRDCLAVSLGLDNQNLVNPDIADLLRSSRSGCHREAAQTAIEAISGIKEMIAYNGNNQLCTELLFARLFHASLGQ